MEKTAQFNEIFDLYYQKILRLSKGYFNGDEAIASDVTQEIFIKIWENLSSFRNESKISTWIYRISVNTCLMYLRKLSTKKEINLNQLPHMPSESYSTEDDERLRKMYACIQKLDEAGKLIILMVLEGIEYHEIAKVVGITEDTLRVRIHRIKKNLI